MKRTTLLLPVLAALSAVASAFGDDASYSLGVPHAPCITNTTNAAKNPWLSTNDCFAVAALFAPVTANLDDQSNPLYFAQTVSGNTSGTETLFRLVACEGGFVVEHSKPEYWLADRLDPPEGVDWVATYARFQAPTPTPPRPTKRPSSSTRAVRASTSPTAARTASTGFCWTAARTR